VAASGTVRAIPPFPGAAPAPPPRLCRPGRGAARLPGPSGAALFAVLGLLALAVQAGPPVVDGGRLSVLHDQGEGGADRSLFDARLEAVAGLGPVDLRAAGVLRVEVAPGAGRGGTGALPGLPAPPEPWLDLTTEAAATGDRRATLRLDRLAATWERRDLRVRLGRDALSLGQGLVFAPLDGFAPFSPTALDTDYKTGVDLLEVLRLLPGGGEVALSAVARDGGDGFSGAASSVALRGRRLVGSLEVSALVGRHVGDAVAAVGLSGPAGPLLWRLDVQRTATEAGARWSGVLNADLPLTWGERSVYLFGEFHRNGFGPGRRPDSLAELPVLAPDLSARLARGEVFTLQRHYLALGGSIDWHPLWTQAALVIGSLDDGSVLTQHTLRWLPDDHQTLEASLIVPVGPRGTEFGGLPLTPGGPAPGEGVRLLLRWARYF
jgi:hypothetical protein